MNGIRASGHPAENKQKMAFKPTVLREKLPGNGI